MNGMFKKLADKVSGVVGSPKWFFFSVTVVVVWFPSGFIIGFNEMWHLMINTFTTIFTFLMMALLHASQSEWEARMEKIQKHQEMMLRLLEKKTQVIGSTLGVEEKERREAEANKNNQTTSSIHG